MEFDERLLMDFNGVTVLKYNNSYKYSTIFNSYKYSTIFNSGISVTIEKADELLQMMLLVPQMYKGMPYLKKSVESDILEFMITTGRGCFSLL